MELHKTFYIVFKQVRSSLFRLVLVLSLCQFQSYQLSQAIAKACMCFGTVRHFLGNYSAILLEGGVTVSNNSTKRRQNGFKIGTRDKFATHLRYENFISNEIVIYTIFFTIGDFPIQFSMYTSCRIHHVF